MGTEMSELSGIALPLPAEELSKGWRFFPTYARA